MAQKLLDHLGMLTHLESYRGSRMAQAVEPDVRETGVFQERLKAAVVKVPRVYGFALLRGQQRLPSSQAVAASLSLF